VLFLRGLAQLGIGPPGRAHGGGEHGPALVRLRVGQGLDLAQETLARRQRRRVRLGGASPPCPSQRARVSPDPIAEGMIPPGLRPTAPTA
jgi:hypothetical protein